MNHKRTGFTLVELLVVMAVIAVLVAILLPAVQAAREAARRTSCQNNLHQIGIAIHQYHEALRHIPSGWMAEVPEGEPGWGWASLILPYMEQQNLQRLVDYGQHIDAPDNEPARLMPISVFFCPSDKAIGEHTFLLEDDPTRDDPHEHDHLPIRIACSNYVGVNGKHAIDMPG